MQYYEPSKHTTQWKKDIYRAEDNIYSPSDLFQDQGIYESSDLILYNNWHL